MIIVTKNPNTGTISIRIDRIERVYANGRDVERPATPPCAVDTFHVAVHLTAAQARKLTNDLAMTGLAERLDGLAKDDVLDMIGQLPDDEDADPSVPLVTDAYDMEGRQ